jgi:hypothetical protein
MIRRALLINAIGLMLLGFTGAHSAMAARLESGHAPEPVAVLAEPGLSWINPNYATALGGLYAKLEGVEGIVPEATWSHWLIAAPVGGAKVPAGATITGIGIDSQLRDYPGWAEIWTELGFMESGKVLGARLLASEPLSGYPNPISVNAGGGEGDRWGRTWTVAQVDSPAFGVMLRVQAHNFSQQIIEVDGLALVVYYTEAKTGAARVTSARLR